MTVPLFLLPVPLSSGFLLPILPSIDPHAGAIEVDQDVAPDKPTIGLEEMLEGLVLEDDPNDMAPPPPGQLTVEPNMAI